MEVPVVKIKEGLPGTEAREKLIKSIVNMVRLGNWNLCMHEGTGAFAAWCFGGDSVGTGKFNIKLTHMVVWTKFSRDLICVLCSTQGLIHWIKNN